MKKLLFLVFLMIVFISCNNNKEIFNTIDVEKITISDQHYMIKEFKDSYNWTEQNIRLKNYLDECSIPEIESITNVFQTRVDGYRSYDVDVIFISHKEDSINDIKKIEGFWIENYPLENINITFEEAFDRLMQSSYPKPHSKNCVLRKKIGLINSNP